MIGCHTSCPRLNADFRRVDLTLKLDPISGASMMQGQLSYAADDRARRRETVMLKHVTGKNSDGENPDHWQ